MRAAIFGDIHGNSIALDAVLADIGQQDVVDQYWLLGDYAAIGHDPVGSIERLSQLPNAILIRGNTDRMLCEDVAPDSEFDKLITEDPAKAKSSARLHASFAWSLGQVQQAGQLYWLSNLPLEYRAALPDGTQILLAHASPGTDTGPGLHPHHTDWELEERFGSDEADPIIVGHTHVPVDRQVSGKHLINASSVSNPFPPDLDAYYLILEADESGYSLRHHTVAYDRQRVIQTLEDLKHPGRDYIIGFMRGEDKADWMR